MNSMIEPISACAERITTLRHVRASDADAIQEILQSDHVNRGTMRLPFESPAGVAQRIAEEPGVVKIVALRQGAVAGYASMVTYPALPRHWHCAEVDIVAVHPDHCGHGVGRHMLQQLIDLGERWLQVRRLALTVWAGNEKAIALYRSLGFLIEGTMRQFVFVDGAYEDAHIMGRLKAVPWPSAPAGSE
ncbi:N-acetyltransferase family protein [Sagittula sp.]|uniref:GNAT family N-acetyltransferase n=1 Tax=Sagittula sp. TaxID=2038081 RepID=UPI003512ACBE